MCKSWDVWVKLEGQRETWPGVDSVSYYDIERSSKQFTVLKLLSLDYIMLYNNIIK